MEKLINKLNSLDYKEAYKLIKTKKFSELYTLGCTERFSNGSVGINYDMINRKWSLS